MFFCMFSTKYERMHFAYVDMIKRCLLASDISFCRVSMLSAQTLSKQAVFPGMAMGLMPRGAVWVKETQGKKQIRLKIFSHQISLKKLYHAMFARFC